MKRILLAGAFALAALTPAAAQQMTAQEFVTAATSSNLFEIESSELAKDRSQDEAIQAFAQQMTADHLQVGEQMKSLAVTAGLEVPTEPEGPPAQLLKEVEAAEGATFDQVYVENQIAGHQAAVELFQTYAENGDNNPLQAMAEELLPALQQHLNTAQSLPGAAAAAQ